MSTELGNESAGRNVIYRGKRPVPKLYCSTTYEAVKKTPTKREVTSQFDNLQKETCFRQVITVQRHPLQRTVTSTSYMSQGNPVSKQRLLAALNKESDQQTR